MTNTSIKTWHFRLYPFHQEAGFFRKRQMLRLPSGEHKIFEAGVEYTTQDPALVAMLQAQKQSSKRNAMPVFEIFDSAEARQRAAARALEARRGSADSPEAVDGDAVSGLSVVAELTGQLAAQAAATKAAQDEAAALKARLDRLEAALGVAPQPVVAEAPAVAEVEASNDPVPTPVFSDERVERVERVENVDKPAAAPAPAPFTLPHHEPRRGRRGQ